MEKAIVHTTQEIIDAFLELPPKQQEEVREFVNSTSGDVDFLEKGFEEEYVEEENYSEEDIAELDRIQEEARRGENVYGPFRGKEAIDFLIKLEKQAQD